MTNQKQRKFKKQKERERIAQAKVLARRTLKRKLEKEKRAIELTLDAESKLFDKQRPFLGPEKQQLRDAQDAEKKESIMAQLKHNLEILEALEEEHIKEQIERDNLNEELEAQGLKTTKEKIEYLKQKAQTEAESVEQQLIERQKNNLEK